MRQQFPLEGGWIRQNLISQGPLAVLAGAGVSRQSGLPIVTDLVNVILRALEAPAALAERVPELPFEAFVNVLGSHTRVDPLLSIYDGGRPNTNHAFLAHALRRGAVADVCTTNFDRLIERAYEAQAAGGVAPLTVLRTTQDLERESWRETRARLTKIHGCASDRREMAITINQVAGRIFSEPRAAAIEHLFATGGHGAVLVIGYSCSDSWDLSPQIESLAARGKPVYVVEHTGGLGDAIEVEPVGERRSHNPFRAYPKGFRVYADTDSLVRLLWQELVPDRDYFPPERQETPWLASVQEWAGALTPLDAGLIRGHLYSLLGMNAESVQEFEGLADAERELTGEVAVSLSNQVGPLLELGETERAAEICKNAVAAFRRRGMRQQLGNQLGWLGNCMNQLRRPEDALTHFREAAEILKSVSDWLGVGNQLGNIANSLAQLGRHEEAIAEYERSLSIAEEVGNVPGVINQLLGLSQAHLALGRPQEALEYSRRGEHFARAFKSREKHARLASLSAIATGMLGNHAAAAGHLEEAIALAREEGDTRFLAKHLIDIAHDFLKLGNWDGVESCAREAQSLGADEGECRYLIALARTKSGRIADAQSSLEAILDDPWTAGEQSRMVTVLQALGDLHVNRGDPATAIPYFQRALALRDGVEVRHDLYFIDESLGRALLLANDPEAARPHIESALEGATRVGDISHQSSCHQLFSWMYRSLGQPEEAREHARRALELAEATDNRELVVWALGDVGNIEHTTGRWGQAFEAYAEGARLSEELGLPTGLLSHRRYLGSLLCQVGMQEYGLPQLEEARNLLAGFFGEQDPDLPSLDSEIRQAWRQLNDHKRKTFLQAWNNEPTHVGDPAVLRSGPGFYAHLLNVEGAPDDLLFYFGRFLYHLKQRQDAAAALGECLNGEHALDAANYLGNLFYVSGQRDEALGYYLRVLASEPEHQNASFMAGLCCKDLDRVAEAAVHYARVTPEHPSYEDALFNLALCAITMKDVGASRIHIEAFVKVNDADPEAWFILASVSAYTGDYDRARFAIQKARSLGADPAKVEPLAGAIESEWRKAENAREP